MYEKAREISAHAYVQMTGVSVQQEKIGKDRKKGR